MGTLRESDPTALRNREKLQQRARPVRGRFICQTLDKRQREEIEAREPWRAADFTRGDVLEVQYKPSVSEEVNAAVGLCIGRIHKGLGCSAGRMVLRSNTSSSYTRRSSRISS